MATCIRRRTAVLAALSYSLGTALSQDKEIASVNTPMMISARDLHPPEANRRPHGRTQQYIPISPAEIKCRGISGFAVTKTVDAMIAHRKSIGFATKTA